MKQYFPPLLLIIVLLPFAVRAQDKFKKGSIVTIDGEKIEGSIKASFGSTGELIFLSTDNKKKTFAPAKLKSFEIDSIRYISFLNDFYEEVQAGERAKLYKKVSDNKNQVMYNESQPVGFVQTTKGSKGDYYLLTGKEMSVELITKKNFKSIFLKLFNGNNGVSEKIQNGTLGYERIREAVELYNE